jgi:phosphoribosyl-ATP pyrophosphohydrolase/phosphoribosyl-AMP cyclohydrolase
MVALADRTALEQTLATGEMHYHSRRRGLWRKGASSGHVQRVRSLLSDCDGDSVLARVESAGPACHTGELSCFGASDVLSDSLSELDSVVRQRLSAPVTGDSYTRRLADDRNLRLKKLGEEAAELAVACADGDADRAIAEAADLFYHALVALRCTGRSLDDVRAVLYERLRERAR